MKLRIAAIIAVVVLVAAIAAYWLDFHEKPAVGSQPRTDGVPAQISPKASVDASPVTTPPVPMPVVRPGLPPATVPPATVASNVPPRVSRLPTPAPKGVTPPVPAPNASPASPANSNPPPPPADPDVIAKAAIELDKVGLMLRDYRTRMGENPVGTNADIMKAVMGGNPKQARLGPPEGQQLNGNGELVDRWGTAYFFHAVSRNDMEIRSAGPDRKMWTEDDVVGR